MSNANNNGRPFVSNLVMPIPPVADRPKEGTRSWSCELYTATGDRIFLPDGSRLGAFRLDCVRDPANPETTRLGWLEYGADASSPKYNTWLFHELGGTAMVIYTVFEGELYIGTVAQKRNAEMHSGFNKTGEILNIPRGFLDKQGDAADEAARQELYEEVGVFAGIPMDLGGQNINVNNAWFSYSDLIVRGRAMHGGVRFYGVRVKPEVLVASSQDALLTVLRNVEPEVALSMIYGGAAKVLEFKAGALKKGSGPDSPYERIKNGVTFVPARIATSLRDGFTATGVGRLRTYLEDRGAAKVTYNLAVLDQ